ncbi:MAG TPA: T9SS type A sorting domain-containing protein, partial [Candidatus Cloacimonadota bacterium]|nr:T9SS type A sorting domain-containing protein [Candidatus Cloacimonadota bacterium]
TQLNLRLYDIRGRLLNTISHAEFAETGSLRIDDLFGLHTLPRGVYVLELQSDNKRFRRKLALR